jgi:drug/metabolite transporter (DMT)-like permease
MHDENADSGADDERGETPLQRLDRNWADLLQELRVVQTGVQLLTGFLLTLPFQSRFDQLTQSGRNVYLATLAASVIATGFLIAPVSLHRFLFRRHARRATVDIAHRLAQTGLAFLAVAIVGVVLLIFDVVAGAPAGAVAAVLAAAMLAVLWVVLPLVVRSRHSGEGPPAYN